MFNLFKISMYKKTANGEIVELTTIEKFNFFLNRIGYLVFITLLLTVLLYYCGPILDLKLGFNQALVLAASVMLFADIVNESLDKSLVLLLSMRLLVFFVLYQVIHYAT